MELDELNEPKVKKMSLVKMEEILKTEGWIESKGKDNTFCFKNRQKNVSFMIYFDIIMDRWINDFSVELFNGKIAAAYSASKNF